MAIRNSAGAVAGPYAASSLPTIQSMTAVGLFRCRQAHTSGGQTVIGAQAGTSNWIAIETEVTSGVPDLRIYTSTEWAVLSGTSYTVNSWVAIGFACSGVGTGLLRIMLSTSSGATPVDLTRTLGGSTGSITRINLIHRTLFEERGSWLDVQNFKYGAGALTAAQMHAEAWSLSIQHSGTWTPTHVPMTSGDLTSQAGVLTLNNSAGLEIVDGPLVAAGGSAAALLRRRRTMNS